MNLTKLPNKPRYSQLPGAIQDILQKRYNIMRYSFGLVQWYEQLTDEELYNIVDFDYQIMSSQARTLEGFLDKFINGQ
jgi:hypothetical protein